MNFRKTLPVIIIAIGVITSISIVSSTGKGTGEISVSSPEGKSDARLDFSSEGRNNSLLKIDNLDSSPQPQKGSTSDEENLTDFFAEIYAKKIFEANDQLKGGGALEAPSPGSINEIEGELLDKIEESFRINRFTEKDLIILEDNSPESQVAYLQTFGEVTSKNYKDCDKSAYEAVEEWMASGGTDTSYLRKYSEMAGKQIDSLLKIKVPSSWKDFHLENLNLWERERQLMKMFINTENDALKSMIALQKMSELEQYNQSISDSFVKNYQELMEMYNEQ